MSRLVLVNDILPSQLIKHGGNFLKQCLSFLLVGGTLEPLNESLACLQLVPISRALRLVGPYPG